MNDLVVHTAAAAAAAAAAAVEVTAVDCPSIPLEEDDATHMANP